MATMTTPITATLRPALTRNMLARITAMLCALLTVPALSASAFEFVVKERGPAASKLRIEITVAVTAEALGKSVKAVIVENDNPDQKVAVAVYLAERIPRPSIAALGKAVREATDNYKETVVSFYLADQRKRIWATAHSTPKLATKIVGLDREAYLVALDAVPRNKLKGGDRLGAEAIMTGANGGSAQIIRNGKRYYFRQYDRNMENPTNTELKRDKGRYWIKCCTGRRYLLTKTAIEIYDDTGFIQSGRRIK